MAESVWSELAFLCPVDLVDVVSGELWELGCAGIAEGQKQGDSVLLQVSFENLPDEDRDRVERVCSERVGRAAFGWKRVQEENWGHTHRRFYPPQPLSSRVYLVPEWQRGEIAVPEGFLPLYLEPGRAFGTGLHPSTKLALWLLEEALNPTARVLDVGTGSGILAIAAVKLGAAAVTGTDNDPEAIEVAQENAQRNAVSLTLSTQDLGAFADRSFEIVVANILLRTHRELYPHYARLLVPGGLLILSGLLEKQVEELEPALAAVGLRRHKAKMVDEWESVAYLLKPKTSP